MPTIEQQYAQQIASSQPAVTPMPTPAPSAAPPTQNQGMSSALNELNARSLEAQNNLLQMPQGQMPAQAGPAMGSALMEAITGAPDIASAIEGAAASSKTPGRMADRGLEDKLDKLVVGGIHNQQSKIENMEDSLNMLRQAESKVKKNTSTLERVDLTPMMAYVDSIVPGSKLVQSYKPPKTTSERTRMIRDMEEKLFKHRNNLIKQKLGYLKGKLSASSQANTYKDRSQRQQEESRARRLKGAGDKVGDYLNSKVYEPLASVKMSLDSMEENFSSGDLARIYASAAQFARTISGERGVLTDRDVQRVLYQTVGKQYGDVIKYITGNTEGSLPPQYTQPLLEMIKVAKKTQLEAYNNKVNSAEKTFRSRGPDYELLWKEGYGPRMFDEARSNVLETYRPGDIEAGAKAQFKKEETEIAQKEAKKEEPKILSPLEWKKSRKKE